MLKSHLLCHVTLGIAFLAFAPFLTVKIMATDLLFDFLGCYSSVLVELGGRFGRFGQEGCLGSSMASLWQCASEEHTIPGITCHALCSLLFMNNFHPFLNLSTFSFMYLTEIT